MPSAAPTSPLIPQLNSTDPSIVLKAVRDIKNQIIGNKTKKVHFINLGIVPLIVRVLRNAVGGDEGDNSSVVVDGGENGGIGVLCEMDKALVVNAAACIGSFSYGGIEEGVKRCLESGAYEYLLRVIKSQDVKVVNAGARALKMIFQSNIGPEFHFTEEDSKSFFLSLLNSENGNMVEFGASIITHSCKTNADQKALCDAGVLHRLVTLLRAPRSQRDASLESLAVILKNNMEIVTEFVSIDGGRAIGTISELTKDRYPRTRLLACACLIGIGRTSPSFFEDVGTKTKLIVTLVQLLEESDQVGDEAPSVFTDLIHNDEGLQKLAFDNGALDKLCTCLCTNQMNPKRKEAVMLAVAQLCSNSEICRSNFKSLQVLNTLTDGLRHYEPDVRIAACICIRNVTRSVKSISAGCVMNEMPVSTLVQLLHDTSIEVQVSALAAICNVVVDFATHKSVFLECGGVKHLVEFSQSMDSNLRLNSVWALRNLMFHAGNTIKEGILKELKPSILASFICDPEPPIQEQALALLRNLIDGFGEFIDHVFIESNLVMGSVERLLWNFSESEICIQAMFVLVNLAAGCEIHKEAVMHSLFPVHVGERNQSVIIKYLQAKDSGLRTASIWCVVNLSYRGCLGSNQRIERLRSAGVVSQIKTMFNDPCLDVKFRVRTALEQCTAYVENCS